MQAGDDAAIALAQRLLQFGVEFLLLQAAGEDFVRVEFVQRLAGDGLQPGGGVAALGTPERPTWLEVTVAEDDYLADLPARIEKMTEGWPVEVLRIRRQRGNAAARLAAAASETLDELDPFDVFTRRLQQEELSDDLQAALNNRYRAIVSALRGEEA